MSPTMRNHYSPHERLVSGLRTSCKLTGHEERTLRDLPLRVQGIAAHEDVVREGDRPGECTLIVDGFFCRHKIIGDGQRQILSFHLPGDVPDLQTLLIDRLDFSLGALVPSQVAFITHAALREAMEEAPALCSIFWRTTLLDAATSRGWISSIGRRPAYQRMAHLFCELYVRMRALGIAEGGGFQLPMTQIELADALGLSPVHINRTLQQLRRDGVIVSRGKYLGFNDWNRLREAGDFESNFLASARCDDQVI